MRLNGKTTIITGAASGIGWASAEAFLRERAKVCLLDQYPERARELLRSLAQRKAIDHLAQYFSPPMNQVLSPVATY
jgi:NAD(P)-dependent dehydrogenase (short-subunit alcohol dehydrogenase family)